MEEQFDIYDESWMPVGTASRRDVHRLGLRHRSFHCWVYRIGSGEPKVLFQKRQLGKDTYPGFLDISAAGHLAAGETVREAVRELEEELGIAAAFEELAYLGWSEARAIGSAGGEPFIDHERSEEYALRCERRPLSLRLQPEEVLGVYEAPLRGMIRLFEGELSELRAEGAELAGGGSAGGEGDRRSAVGGGGEDADGGRSAVGGGGEDADGGRSAGGGGGEDADGGRSAGGGGGEDADGGRSAGGGGGGSAGDGNAGDGNAGDGWSAEGRDAGSAKCGKDGGDANAGDGAPALVAASLAVRAEHFVPRHDGYYAGLFRRLLQLAEAGGKA
ncbi:NUDIX hydrolase [Paenibacillus sp. B01]|uniref:NUDIX hydrolase n=1 Tax=Paenibacillus sp. B01 TaxID=2660554 RepID=UPI00129AF232|nr:NUDIX domain-containing protein [Paenibacillus sp. B01]QGG58025.1 NUDIX domain-containing protein [Paenibacillus sp. B01]